MNSVEPSEKSPMRYNAETIEPVRLPFDMGSLVEAFKHILNRVYSGIIFCDKDSRILFMNRFYASLLKADPEEAVGKHIKAYFPSSRLPVVLETGQAELGKKCSLRTNLALLVNRVPIEQDGKTVGVVLQTTFRDFTEINDVMTRLNLLEKEVTYYKEGLDSILSATYSFDSIVGGNKRLVDAKKTAEKYARTDSPVLILGATGTGKELFAHAVHRTSGRKDGPFVCVNCAAIPRELLESELFGYAPGAFTGAKRGGKAGKIEMAHGGTLFLDEIGDLPLNAQAKLLRVLETKKIERVGGVKAMDVDFRLVAATNKGLREMIHRNEFREDLFYRLNTLTVEIPSLSERTDDISELVYFFLKSSGNGHIQVSEAVLQMLECYSWPGNVRELKNVVMRGVSLIEGDRFEVEHLPMEIVRFQSDCSDTPSRMGPLSTELKRYEKKVLAQALRLNHGNMSKTAKVLGISRSTLYEKCRLHEL
ncbi:MAG: sigma 54-interacting transcriptional regulator [Deltaproteobacteria bacterium]|nr:sigma 54-interacting transcriptional regulator [Deltaproteobacteria bacterium]